MREQKAVRPQVQQGMKRKVGQMQLYVLRGSKRMAGWMQSEWRVMPMWPQTRHWSTATGMAREWAEGGANVDTGATWEQVDAWVDVAAGV